VKVFSIGMAAGASDGGLERYYFNLFAALPAAGSQPRGLVVGRSDGSCDGAPLVSSFARSGDSMLKRWRLMRKAAPALLAGADVAVSHFAPNAFPILGALRKRPFVVHFHGPWALEGRAEGGARWKTAVRQRIERPVYDAATRFIVLSRAFRDVLERHYSAAAERIRVVRGGVDLERFNALGSRREARERLGWPVDRPVVTTARRLVPSKGVEDLIDAAVDVRRASPDVLFNILGAGPLRGALERRIAERGLARHVALAGHVSDEELALAYRASDLFVVPSVAFEGFGLVAIESLACGTPVLVTDIGGLPEVVEGLERGLVIEGAGPAALARAIAGALGGRLPVPPEAACIAHANTFAWRSVAADVQAVYREAVVAGACG
jgi:glycosyltransferase involved in cell wall biosynthesis